MECHRERKKEREKEKEEASTDRVRDFAWCDLSMLVFAYVFKLTPHANVYEWFRARCTIFSLISILIWTFFFFIKILVLWIIVALRFNRYSAIAYAKTYWNSLRIIFENKRKNVVFSSISWIRCSWIVSEYFCFKFSP